MIRTTKAVVKEVAIAIAFLCLLEEAIVLLLVFLKLMVFDKNTITIFIGLFVGSIFSVLMFVHMAYSLEVSVDMIDEEQADKHTKKTYGFRTLFLLVGIVVSYFTTWVDIIALLIGVMNLKLAIYLQPIVHKLLEGFHNR